MSRPRKKPTSQQSPPPPDRYLIEGFDQASPPNPSSPLFRRPDMAPSVFNGVVRVDRYRVTVERIEEPREVLLARLDALFQQTDNTHHLEALCREARRRFGVYLFGDDVRVARGAVAFLGWLLSGRGGS